ncbi:MAG: serine protease [Natronospirillum sp.]|uniref:serine protease n=1 Tax=Natronospirillum sp. TaxID=2812955 RepID=UPI0026010A7C|nr:serine protease [Natronospirillum sp.]MCH8552679.1 serine protease [Natronospirillum sp.]
MKTGFRLITLTAIAALALSANAFYMDARIIGGEDAVAGEVPWQVALISNKNDAFSSQYCGGSIIDEEWIVSAAHCLFDNSGEQMASAGYILAGVLKLSDGTGSDFVEVESFELHPDYDDVTFEHDIALLKLSEPLDLDGLHSERIAWLVPELDELEEQGTPVTVSGWGSIDPDPDVGDYPDELQVVELEMIDCSSTGYSDATDNMLCATNEGYTKEGYTKDSCVGDSGGPMAVQKDSGDWYLSGIVSFGPPECATDNLPGVYTRVSQYNAWIQEITGLEPPEGTVIEDVDSGASGGSGSSGGGGSSSSGSMANPATWLMLLLLGGLALSARWKRVNQPAGGRS